MIGGRVVRGLAVVLALGFTTLFLFIGSSHVLYPYELEWYEGLLLEHVARILAGATPYPEPSIAFVAALYQPGYYYLTAAVTWMTGESLYFAGRLVSLLSVLGVAAMIPYVGKRISNADWVWRSAVGIGLFLGAYAITGFSYSHARLDAAMILPIMLAMCVVLSGQTITKSIVAGLLLGLAFFIKQPALFFFPAFLGWLMLRNRSAAIAAGSALIIAIAIGLAFLQRSSDGWYTFYAFDVTSVKSADMGWLRALTVMPTHILRYWSIALVVVIVGALSATGSWGERLRSPNGLIYLTLVCAILQAAVQRGDQMSYLNVYVPLACFMAVGFATSMSMSSTGSAFYRFAGIATVLQLGALLYDPREEPKVLIDDQTYRRDASFVEYLRSMPGPVALRSHGTMPGLSGKKMEAAAEQFVWEASLASGDVSRSLKHQWDSLLAAQYFSAIIVDSNIFSRPDSIPRYTLAARVPEHARFSSRIGASLTTPTYIFVPRP